MKLLKQLLLPFYFRYRFVRYFFQFQKPIGFINQIWSFFHGFFPKNFVLFSLSEKDPKLYLSDYRENFKATRVNLNASIINNKLIFTELLKPYVNMPLVKGVVEAGQWISYGNNSCRSIEELLSYAKESKGVIFKPIEGDGGEGIFKLYWDNKVFFWNQNPIDEPALMRVLKSLNHYFISDLVQQHEYASKIYPKGISTIRILTMIQPETKIPFIAAAAHRLANDRSFPVDNCAKGGFTAKIDLESGQLGPAVRTSFPGKGPVWYSQHPDTNQNIEGVMIPNWRQIKEKVLELAEVFCFVPYIGWDIVLLPSGEITILEANDGPDLKLHQVHTPLLSDQRIVNFYRYHKVI